MIESWEDVLYIEREAKGRPIMLFEGGHVNINRIIKYPYILVEIVEGYTIHQLKSLNEIFGGHIAVAFEKSGLPCILRFYENKFLALYSPDLPGDRFM